MRHDHTVSDASQKRSVKTLLRSVANRSAVLAWTIALLVVCASAAVAPHTRTLYPTYATAGLSWRTGYDAYAVYFENPGTHLDQYRYSPTFTAAMVPWSYLPERLGGVLWRLTGAAALILAAVYWLRHGVPTAVSPGWLIVLLLPLSLESLQNGQVNIHVAALLLVAVTAAGQGRWWLAGFCIAGATALKAYPLAVGLLILAAYPRRFIVPLVVAHLAIAALPFALQRPSYVLSQYEAWYRICTLNETRHELSPQMAYRDLWLLLRQYGPPLDRGLYPYLQLAGAGLCAALAFLASRERQRPEFSPRDVLLLVLNLGTGWMLLCGPSTESSTYLLLGPPLAYALLTRSGRSRWLLYGSAGLVVTTVLSGLFPGGRGYHAFGPHALAALLFSAAVVFDACWRLTRRAGHVMPEPRRLAA